MPYEKLLLYTIILVGSWKEEERDKDVYQSIVLNLKISLFVVVANFCFIFFIIFNAFRTLKSISPATVYPKIFIAGAKHFLSVAL